MRARGACWRCRCSSGCRDPSRGPTGAIDLSEQIALATAALLGGEVAHAESLGGGCLEQVTRITLRDGRRAVAKGGPAPRVEAEMLDALRGAGAPAPRVLAGDDALLVDGDSVSALIDPACYHGHGEVDLAMLTLFDRPDARFFDAYPVTADWRERLSGRARRYLFVSTAAVYDGKHVTPPAREDAAPRTLADPATETIDGETYGGLKVLCEPAAEEAFAGEVRRSGPPTSSGRTTTPTASPGGCGACAEAVGWVAPVEQSLLLAFVDGRDLGRFTVRLAEGDAVGAVNASGPAVRTTWGEALALAR